MNQQKKYSPVGSELSHWQYIFRFLRTISKYIYLELGRLPYNLRLTKKEPVMRSDSGWLGNLFFPVVWLIMGLGLAKLLLWLGLWLVPVARRLIYLVRRLTGKNYI